MRLDACKVIFCKGQKQDVHLKSPHVDLLPLNEGSQTIPEKLDRTGSHDKLKRRKSNARPGPFRKM
jgi:hypothetical protein